MKILSILVSTILLFGCETTKESKPVSVDTQPALIKEPVYSLLQVPQNIFMISNTFDDGSEAVGQAVILEHLIFTVGNMFHEDKYGSYALEIIGKSDVHGFTLCREKEHFMGEGAWYYFMNDLNKSWNIGMMGSIEGIEGEVIGFTDLYYYVDFNHNVTPGISGTPVFCLEHGGVIGLMWGYFAEPNVGIVHKIYEKDLSL